MPRYSLRTLLILLAIGPPLVVACFWLWHWTITRLPEQNEIIVEEWMVDSTGTKERLPARKR